MSCAAAFPTRVRALHTLQNFLFYFRFLIPHFHLLFNFHLLYLFNSSLSLFTYSLPFTRVRALHTPPKTFSSTFQFHTFTFYLIFTFNQTLRPAQCPKLSFSLSLFCSQFPHFHFFLPLIPFSCIFSCTDILVGGES